MSVLLLLVVVVMTAGSRIAALALLPEPDGALAVLADRLPAPLFASLAAASLFGAGGLPDPAVLTAACCAVVAARWRSLLVTLLAGMAGYLVVSSVW